MALEGVLAKFSQKKYLRSEHDVLNMVMGKCTMDPLQNPMQSHEIIPQTDPFMIGINGAINVDLVMGIEASTLRHQIHTMLMSKPAPVLAVKSDKWESKWSDLVETWAPDYMEDILSGLGGSDLDTGKMSIELKTWNDKGDGVGIVVTIQELDEDDVDLADFGEEEDEGDFVLIKKRAMNARGWRVLDANTRKRKFKEEDGEDDEDDEEDEDEEDEDENEDDDTSIPPSKVDLFIVVIGMVELGAVSGSQSD